MKKNPFRAVGRSPRRMPIRNRRFTETLQNPALAAILMDGSLSTFCVSSFAQSSETVAERDVQRRQSAIRQGDAAPARAKAAMQATDYTVADEEVRTAVSY